MHKKQKNRKICAKATIYFEKALHKLIEKTIFSKNSKELEGSYHATTEKLLKQVANTAQEYSSEL